MIFGTVGTHTQGFDRLVVALDDWARTGAERVVIQTGASQYEPRHAEWFRFESPERIESLMREARVVVTHAGAGSLLSALDWGKPVLAMPRLASLHEHVDDHQIEICEALEQSGWIRVLTQRADFGALMAVVDERSARSPSVSRAAFIATIAEAVSALSPKPTSDGTP